MRCGSSATRRGYNLPGSAPCSRRREQQLSTLALIEARRADIGYRELPRIDDLPIKAAVRPGGRQLHNNRTFLQISVGSDVRRTAIRSDCFKFRRRRCRIGDDVVVLHAEIGECAPPQRIDCDCRHVPKHRLECAVVFDLIVEILGRRFGSLWRLSAEGLLSILGESGCWREQGRQHPGRGHGERRRANAAFQRVSACKVKMVAG